MTGNLLKLATGRAGHGCLGGSSRTVSRALATMLVLILFAVDTFQPIIGLVEVGRSANQDQAAQVTSRTSTPHPKAGIEPAGVTIQAYQWQASASELWPAFVFQPTISAGGGGTVAPSSTLCLGSSAAALPSSVLPPVSSACTVHRYLAPPVDVIPILQVAWSREICPIGPPCA
jgi:hypothetical protein